jgi:hypothetical protein
MGVARQIGEHGLRTAKRLLRIDHPFGLAQRREEGKSGRQSRALFSAVIVLGL